MTWNSGSAPRRGRLQLLRLHWGSSRRWRRQLLPLALLVQAQNLADNGWVVGCKGVAG